MVFFKSGNKIIQNDILGIGWGLRDPVINIVHIQARHLERQHNCWHIGVGGHVQANFKNGLVPGKEAAIAVVNFSAWRVKVFPDVIALIYDACHFLAVLDADDLHEDGNAHQCQQEGNTQVAPGKRALLHGC